MADTVRRVKRPLTLTDQHGAQTVACRFVESKGEVVASDRVLLWDFDGTLAERPGMWSGALLEVLDEQQPGHGLTRAKIASVLSSGFPWHNPATAHPELADADAWWSHVIQVVSKALTRLGMAPGRAASAARLMRSVYPALNRWCLFDDTIPTLTRLSESGWRHVVVSNHVPELPEIMAALGLSDHFVAVINSAVTGYEKPHPQAFRIALAAVEFPRHVWMIGDNHAADVAGATAVGIDAILVRRPNSGVRHYAPTLAALVEPAAPLVSPRS